MPKRKSKGNAKRSVSQSQEPDSRSSMRNLLVRWAAISVILTLMLSLLVAAISLSPASAAPTWQAESATPCAPIDSDGDAITNDLDPDIDGDGVVNGLDDDIDGDKILNGADTDPAATNCGKNAAPPVILPEPKSANPAADTTWIAISIVALLGLGYLVLRRMRAAKK